MNSATDVIVAIIMVALVSMLVTRPGVSEVIKGLSTYLAASIKATLGG